MNVLPLAMLALMALGFYFLVLRPAKSRQAEQLRLINEIQVGQRVMTTAGLFGTVHEITDDDIALEIAPGVVVRMVKQAIAKSVEPITSESSPSDGENTDTVAQRTITLEPRADDAVDTAHKP